MKRRDLVARAGNLDEIIAGLDGDPTGAVEVIPENEKEFQMRADLYNIGRGNRKRATI